MKRTTLLTLFLIGLGVGGSNVAAQTEPDYTIAFASFGPRNADLYIADADGSNPRPLLPHAENDSNASFSADGRWVIFTSHRQGSADIYRVRPDGTGLERLTDDPGFDDQGAMSPDGRRLAFVSNRGGHANLWLLDLGTRKVSRLTEHGDGDFRPAWSPDGEWVAFSSDRDSKKPRGKSGFQVLHSTEIYLVRPDGSDLRRVTKTQKVAGSPTWSPDGKRLAIYEAEFTEVELILTLRRLRGTTQIATVDVRTGERVVVTSGPGEKWSPRWLAADRIGYVSGGPEGGVEFTAGPDGARGAFGGPSWSPDGRHMVFHRDVGPDWPPPPFREWPGRDRQFRMVRTGIFQSYSPSGGRLVCNDQPGGILHNSILAMDADGANRSVLFTNPDPEKSALAPAWSPKGDKVAFGLGRFFQAINGPAFANIAVVGTDGKGLRMLTDGKGNNGFPSWAPDGRRLVYRTSGGTTSGLVILDVETGESKELKTGSTRDNFPAWSPDGERIAFTSHRDGDYEVCTVKPDGTDLRRLTHAPGNDAHCAWSPDGKWIAFSSGRGGFKDEAALHPYNAQPYGQVYAMRADGSDVRQLTDDEFEHGTVAFAPVGNPK